MMKKKTYIIPINRVHKVNTIRMVADSPSSSTTTNSTQIGITESYEQAGGEYDGGGRYARSQGALDSDLWTEW